VLAMHLVTSYYGPYAPTWIRGGSGSTSLGSSKLLIKPVLMKIYDMISKELKWDRSTF